MEALEGVQVAALLARILFDHGPEIIKLVHDIVHELKDHAHPSVAAKAEELHQALHGDEPPRSQP